jgi:hypothetical protein
MEDDNRPDRAADRAEPSEDEEIIELTEEITNPPEEDDEIIELTDIVDRPFREDEDIIELVEVADEPQVLEPADAAGETPDEEDILELTDLVDEPSKEPEKEPDLADIFQDEAVEIDESPNEEIGILQDLETEADTGETAIEFEAEKELDELESMDSAGDMEIEEACSKIKETALSEEPEIMGPAIEFEHEAEAEEMEPAEPEEEAEAEEAEVIEISKIQAEHPSPREYPTSPDMLPLEEAEEQGVAPWSLVGVSAEQVDAALERVVKKMYAEKIDRILVEVIEKTVTKEIEKLKRIILEDTE